MEEKSQTKKREKLVRFKTFAGELLPHEVHYLQAQAAFSDSINAALFKQLCDFVLHPEQDITFDPKIDKRKYTYLKNWVEKQLAAIDADHFFEWMHQLDLKLMTDQISPDEEIELLGKIKRYSKPSYYFMRFYELVQNYRNYLLIRVRGNYLPVVSTFLVTFKQQYQEAIKVNHLLHDATNDIVNQYLTKSGDSIQWEENLVTIFQNEHLDGLNRYYAVVRLSFIYFNYRAYDKLSRLYNALDKLIVSGEIYSRRILVNYYANRLLLHSRYNELDTAASYGYLSIKAKSSDYLFYLNNLCGVLLRRKKTSEALQLMEENLSAFQKNISPHTRIGFASYYLKSLNENAKYTKARRFASHFLDQNIHDILKFRWRLFFLAYAETLLYNKDYLLLLRVFAKYKLLNLELVYKQNTDNFPTLECYHLLAQYKEAKISLKKLKQSLVPLFKNNPAPQFQRQMSETLKHLKIHLSDPCELQLFDEV